MPAHEIPGPQGTLAVDDGALADGGAPVLFVHSDGGNVTHWREALAHVRSTRRAVALDLRGHGASSPAANGDYSARGRADDVAAAVDALGLARPVLVGHSGGGAVALEYAARHPNDVSGLLLVDPAADGRQFPEEQRRRFLALLRSAAYADTVRDYYQSIAGPNPAVRERVLRDALATPPATIVGTFEALGEWDPGPALAAYRGPRLALVTPLNESPAALHRIDTSLPHQAVAGTGHWLQLDDPGGFQRALDGFLGNI